MADAQAPPPDIWALILEGRLMLSPFSANNNFSQHHRINTMTTTTPTTHYFFFPRRGIAFTTMSY